DGIGWIPSLTALGPLRRKKSLLLVVAKGARTAARPASIDLPGVEAIGLDVTEPDQVDAAARAVGAADIVINNAGFSSFARLRSDGIGCVPSLTALGPLRRKKSLLLVVAKGARTAARPASIDLPGVEAIGLDVTEPDQVDAAARAVGAADIVINNAGFSSFARL